MGLICFIVFFLGVLCYEAESMAEVNKENDNLRNVDIIDPSSSKLGKLKEIIIFHTKNNTGSDLNDHVDVYSKCITVGWNKIFINMVDTNGKSYFKQAVDGAVFILSSVSGVDSQFVHSFRNWKHQNISSMVFVDHTDPVKDTLDGVLEKLIKNVGVSPLQMHLPLSQDDKLNGVIDLVSMKAFLFSGKNGDTIKESTITGDMLKVAKQKRAKMMESIAKLSHEIARLLSDNKEVSVNLIHKTIREATIARKIVPVFVGSVSKNVGIQMLLTAIEFYLPAPNDVKHMVRDLANDGETVELDNTPDTKCVALCLSEEHDNNGGYFSFVRIYQGYIKTAQQLSISTHKFPGNLMARKRSRGMDRIRVAYAGDIIRMYGRDCSLGETICDPSLGYTFKPAYTETDYFSNYSMDGAI